MRYPVHSREVGCVLGKSLFSGRFLPFAHTTYESHPMGKIRSARVQSVRNRSNSFLVANQPGHQVGWSPQAHDDLEQPADDTSEIRYEYESAPYVEICSPDTSAEQDMRLDTLLQAVGEEVAKEFEWVAETDTIQTYEHRVTLRYVHIDSVSGQFCDQQRNPTSRELALSYALPLAQTPTYELATAPVAFEPTLGAFLRRVQSGTEDGGHAARSLARFDAARWTRMLSGMYRRLAFKLSASSRQQDAMPFPGRERPGAVSVPFGGSDHSERGFAAFTRRAA